MTMQIKIATLDGVREHNEGCAPVEIWLRGGRTVIRAFNECGNNYTDVDLADLLHWGRGKDYNTDEVVAEYRIKYPDLTHDEEAAIRSHVINGTSLFLRCTAFQPNDGEQR